MFCNSTVPLARMKGHIFKNNESFTADIEVAHFGNKPLENQNILCKVLNTTGEVLFSNTLEVKMIEIGSCMPAGSFTADLSSVEGAQKLVFEVSLVNTPYLNRWDLWVYPSDQEADTGTIFVTDRLDDETENILKSGGSVLLLSYGKVAKGRGAEVALGFSSIFWNTAWTNNQPPHTLGILCDPQNPLFSRFPTEYHSNWQWWDPVSNSQAMKLDGFPESLKPLIQPIDTWFENRKLALAFEARSGGGKILVCSIDMKNLDDERIVTKQLLSSMLEYMNSS